MNEDCLQKLWARVLTVFNPLYVSDAQFSVKNGVIFYI